MLSQQLRVGCPTGAKQSMLVTYVPRVLRASARMRNGRAVVAAVLAALAFGSARDARAFSSGITGRTAFGPNPGCTCHSAAASMDTTIALTPSSTIVVPGSGTNVKVEITSPVPTTGVNQGGFDLAAIGGTLSPIDLTVQIASGEATHAQAGNDTRTWTVHWEPPSPPAQLLCTYDFSAAGNAVNGINGADSGDHWSFGGTLVTVDGSNDAAPPPEPAIVVPQPGKIYVNNTVRNSPGPAIILGTLALKATANDETGIDRVEFRDTDFTGEASLGNGVYDRGTSQFTFPWNTAAEPPGPHTLTVRAIDCGGNQTDATIDVFVL